jgi:signal peptidase II
MFYWVAAAVFVLDQLSKLLARGYLADAGPSVILRNFLWLRYAQNTGGAFSMLSDHSAVLTLASVAAVVIIFVWHCSLGKGERWQQMALGLIFGGAVGNLFDRLLRGYVVDFIDAHWYNRYHWPTFNLADSAICVGIACFIAVTLLSRRREKSDTAATRVEDAAPATDKPST